MRKTCSFIIVLLVCMAARSQSKLGDVAVVYITTANLDSSVAFYEKLGFPKVASNEFPQPWAQVSDGSLLIMLRKDANPYIGLTYYSAAVDQVVAQLEKEGIGFEKKPGPNDPIKRYIMRAPDGFSIILSNNLGGFKQPTGATMLTMNPVDFAVAEKYPNSQCGVFGELAIPVPDLAASVAFWEKLGFTSKGQMNQPYPLNILSDGLMIIGLHQTNHFNFPAITYFGLEAGKRIEQLKQKGLTNMSEVIDKNNVDLKTWEGQHFFIFAMGM